MNSFVRAFTSQPLYFIQRRLNVISKILFYEVHYWQKKFRPYGFILLVISLIQSIILSLGDAQDFLSAQVPHDWKFISNLDKNFIKLTSVLIIVIPSLLFWLRDVSEGSKAKSELAQVVNEEYASYIGSKLRNLISRYVNKKLNCKGNIRVSLFIPVRIRTFYWQLKMICGTANIHDQEVSKLSFNLGEGALGYTLLQVNPEYAWKVQAVNILDHRNSHKGYTDLRHSNAVFLGEIKVVLVVAALQEGSIIGLIAIDSDDVLDYNELFNGKDGKVHSYILDWLDKNKRSIELLWSVKNRV
jgi:hypothetical protein